ncbi:bestrophin homolog [Caerostris extrusa]|uniref:Bestrophin homolog n=1 Tax=Caerostris extrusa TaxID=172846 RepID=A0AAV4P5S3_CAEEX|nr:bestrophin homolog [Caerostris extrusa]
MTVSYQYDVASSTSGGFIRLLFRWRGSIWKLVYVEMSLFTAAYFTLTMLYRFLFSESQKKDIRKNCVPMFHFYGFNTSQFCVGFLCLFHRHQMVESIHSHSLARQIDEQYFFFMYVAGTEETDRVLRRTLMRYLNLALILVLRSISMAVKKISDQRTRCRSRFHDKIRIGDVKLSSINGI